MPPDRIPGLQETKGEQGVSGHLQDRIARLYQQAVEERRGKRDGVVVTPVEVVDFQIRSTIDGLKLSHNTGLTNPRVKILDPFGGTGIYAARLLELSGLTGDELDDLASRIVVSEIDHTAACMARVNLAHVIAKLGGTVIPRVTETDTFDQEGWPA